MLLVWWLDVEHEAAVGKDCNNLLRPWWEILFESRGVGETRLDGVPD